MKGALILMAVAFLVAVAKGLFGAPVIDGVTFLVFVLVLASLATYWRWAVAPRQNR